ncbi:hypothetical protein [Burkholderia thailandensis]|uniref:hypothetical protein n=1 Tax=Burkholderia thailandensis TaxID=57975 RepID=UPI00217E30D4|nr:hypothetical protein [Burkholderia thailandensis]
MKPSWFHMPPRAPAGERRAAPPGAITSHSPTLDAALDDRERPAASIARRGVVLYILHLWSMDI